MRAARLVVFSVLMVATALLLGVVSGRPWLRLDPFASDVVNHLLSYQLSALPVAGLALLLTFLFAPRLRLAYLHPRRTGEMRPLRGGSGGGRWETDAWPIALVMVVIAGVAAYVQLAPGGFAFHWAHVLLAVPLAATNAFTEEVVFRLSYVTVGADATGSRLYGLVMGTLVFGVLHYWGVTPNGWAGALMAALVGFVLARSIQDTRGFTWAFSVHFLLNVVGLVLVLNQAA